MSKTKIARRFVLCNLKRHNYNFPDFDFSFLTILLLRRRTAHFPFARNPVAWFCLNNSKMHHIEHSHWLRPLRNITLDTLRSIRLTASLHFAHIEYAFAASAVPQNRIGTIGFLCALIAFNDSDVSKGKHLKCHHKTHTSIQKQKKMVLFCTGSGRRPKNFANQQRKHRILFYQSNWFSFGRNWGAAKAIFPFERNDCFSNRTENNEIRFEWKTMPENNVTTCVYSKWKICLPFRQCRFDNQIIQFVVL